MSDPTRGAHIMGMTGDGELYPHPDSAAIVAQVRPKDRGHLSQMAPYIKLGRDTVYRRGHTQSGGCHFSIELDGLNVVSVGWSDIANVERLRDFLNDVIRDEPLRLPSEPGSTEWDVQQEALNNLEDGF